jgi:oligopeptide transport system substrate-binding protein
MKKNLPGILFICIMSFCSCSNKTGGDDAAGKAKGGVVYGGVLRVNEVENIRSLIPVAINEMNSFHIATQVYEGLVRYDQADLSIIPALARSWDVNKELTEYTFHIRPDVKFHNDACFNDSVGRTVNAHDVKYCFENLCSKSVNNNQFEVTFRDRVAGANEYYAQSMSGKIRTFTGITVVNDSTVKIRLTQPDANFLHILAMPGCYIYPKEAEIKYGSEMRTHCVGTGPFYIAEFTEGVNAIMKKNPEYWGFDRHGNRLPYLDTIKWTFIRDKKSEVMEFRRGKLDMIYRIPVEMFNEIFGEINDQKKNLDFEIYSSPALSTHYYGFNMQTNPFFSLKEVRRAFNLAIDRHKIADFTIKGEGRPADYGIVPYTEVFERNGYDYKKLKGFTFDPDSARKLLASVGYPNGKGLPDFNLEINSGGGDRNIVVAVVIQKMLKENIGVNMNMNVVTWPQHVENVQTGKNDFFRYAWVSDYADPESFLTLFYGKHVPENYQDRSYINLGRFKNRTFDSLYLAAKSQPDKKKRYKLYSMAEQVVLDEAAFMPLFYDENFRLVQKNVRNLEENPLNYVDMRSTYLLPGKVRPLN